MPSLQLVYRLTITIYRCKQVCKTSCEIITWAVHTSKNFSRFARSICCRLYNGGYISVINRTTTCNKLANNILNTHYRKSEKAVMNAFGCWLAITTCNKAAMALLQLMQFLLCTYKLDSSHCVSPQ